MSIQVKVTTSVRFNLVLAICLLSNGDLFAFSDEPEDEGSLKSHVRLIIDKLISVEKNKLTKLELIRERLGETAQNFDLDHKGWASSGRRIHEDPIGAFVTVRRLRSLFNEIEELLNNIDGDQEHEKLQDRFERLATKYNVPTEKDLHEHGETLLRLRAFYNLNIDDLASGSLHDGHSRLGLERGYRMDSEDCFEVGQIAYYKGQYRESIVWLQKSLQIIEEENEGLLNGTMERNDFERYSLARSVAARTLDYLAHAAYKVNQTRYAAQLTKQWLRLDPESERAKYNLEYYEEFQANGHEIGSQIGDDGAQTSNEFLETFTHPAEQEHGLDYKFDINDYSIVEDKTLRNLCRDDTFSTEDKRCIVDSALVHSYPELRVEILHTDPYIVRIYDIVTEKEAGHLIKSAMPKLHRSTVQTEAGLVTSDFRIAQTAWLSRHSDPTVEQIERRVSGLLNLNMNGSEHLQVVNYKIGGFYGPHLDAARKSGHNLADDSLPISNLARNDRLATVLIYLNDVEAGGSTVFPRLNLKVRPVARSAVVWYNILKNGLGDARTLHTGCPVLLGTKWVATIWPREAANSFLRPCGLGAGE